MKALFLTMNRPDFTPMNVEVSLEEIATNPEFNWQDKTSILKVNELYYLQYDAGGEYEARLLDINGKELSRNLEDVRQFAKEVFQIENLPVVENEGLIVDVMHKNSLRPVRLFMDDKTLRQKLSYNKWENTVNMLDFEFNSFYQVETINGVRAEDYVDINTLPIKGKTSTVYKRWVKES